MSHITRGRHDDYDDWHCIANQNSDYASELQKKIDKLEKENAQLKAKIKTLTLKRRSNI